MVDDLPPHGLKIRTRIRIILERLWLLYGSKYVDQFIVQTLTMRSLLFKKLRRRSIIKIAAFIENKFQVDIEDLKINNKTDVKYDFVYVASGEPHKNHKLLIQAWCELAEANLFPSLVLTLDECFFNVLTDKQSYTRCLNGLKIINLGHLEHECVLDLYKQCGALIFPSKFESFGMPLIEAKHAGLAILASELDYVRDLIDPDQSFDPDSSVSIARAIRRFLKEDNKSLSLINGLQFIDLVFVGKSP